MLKKKLYTLLKSERGIDESSSLLYDVIVTSRSHGLCHADFYGEFS